MADDHVSRIASWLDTARSVANSFSILALKEARELERASS
jgi:hypothetical protein